MPGRLLDSYRVLPELDSLAVLSVRLQDLLQLLVQLRRDSSLLGYAQDIHKAQSFPTKPTRLARSRRSSLQYN